MYGQLFNFIIDQVNVAICQPNLKQFIGVLDIFGFENFKVYFLHLNSKNLMEKLIQKKIVEK